MLASLVVYFVTLRLGYGTLDVRALTFSTLIVANVALIFTNRSFTRPCSWNGGLRTWRCGRSAPGCRRRSRCRSVHPAAARSLSGDAASRRPVVVAIAGLGALLWMEVVKRAAFEGGRSAR
jgi:hypothetical protein